jgi:hypothetical protein
MRAFWMGFGKKTRRTIMEELVLDYLAQEMFEELAEYEEFTETDLETEIPDEWLL